MRAVFNPAGHLPGGPQDIPIYELERISHRFEGTRALVDVSLRIWPGEQVALVGPSGAGKSTLLRLLNGGLLPDHGEIRILGREPARLSPRELHCLQAQIGTIYQQFHLVDTLRVVHNINAGHLSRWSLPKAILSLFWPLEVNTAAHALEEVGIPEKLYERTDRLSGGQQQRVAIARVLVQNPAVILADEPVSNIDPERSREILELLQRINQQTGKTLVISLHTLELALRYCQRIIGLRAGRILFDAPTASVTPEMVADLYRIETQPEGSL